jgi:hypothetical protein
MIAALLPLIGTVLDKAIPDKDERNRLAHEIATLAENHAHEIALQQIEVNKLDAKGEPMQRNWRPFIGWVCGVAFAYHFVVQPVLVFGFAIAEITIPPLPEFDMTSLLTVLGGLLGLGTLRTFEKYKGVTK